MTGRCSNGVEVLERRGESCPCLDFTPSFRGASKRRTRNLEIWDTMVFQQPLDSGLAAAHRPGMTEEVDGMTEEAATMLWDRLGTPAQ